MASQDKMNLVGLRAAVRRQLGDPSARWWTDTQLNHYLQDWQCELVSRYEFRWERVEMPLSGPTIELPEDCRRPHSVWVGGVEVPYKRVEELWQDRPLWMWEAGPRIGAWTILPNRVMRIWPAPTSPIELELEYVVYPLMSEDNDTHAGPAFMWHSAIPYSCMRAYQQPGPLFDLNRAAKWRARWQRWLVTLDKAMNSWWGLRPPALKMENKFERILHRPSGPIPEVNMPGEIIRPALTKGSVTGLQDGVNTVFTLTDSTNVVMVFADGNLLTEDVDYVVTGVSIVFTTPPPAEAAIVVYYSGVSETPLPPSGGASIPIITVLSGVPDGVNTTFTFPEVPLVAVVVVNGVTYLEGGGFTRVGATVELTYAPGIGEAVLGYYWV